MQVRHPYLDSAVPIALAHRGGAHDAPENTIRAFQRAIDLGYRYLETDVQLTVDGVLLAFHDDDLRRTCGRSGRVADLPWSEVAEARVSGTEPIPRFEELLETWPEVRVNVDCKDMRCAAPLIDAITRHDAFDRVCVAAFSDRRIRALRRMGGPRLCTSAARLELAALWALGVRVAGDCAQVPARRGPVPVVTERFVARAHRRRLAVHVWTIDDGAEMDRLLDLGVDGIITDRPEVLRDVLERRGQWHA